MGEAKDRGSKEARTALAREAQVRALADRQRQQIIQRCVEYQHTVTDVAKRIAASYVHMCIEDSKPRMDVEACRRDAEALVQACWNCTPPDIQLVSPDEAGPAAVERPDCGDGVPETQPAGAAT